MGEAELCWGLPTSTHPSGKPSPPLCAVKNEKESLEAQGHHASCTTALHNHNLILKMHQTLWLTLSIPKHWEQTPQECEDGGT